jgi:F0F1-type ATP synthase membrane subunit c/vacuolar-type H+-ATPase subunit K
MARNIVSPTSREVLINQFRTTNYIGLAMIGTVFLYAGLVLGINHGIIPIKIRPSFSTDASANIKYIMLFISVLHYFIIKFFQRTAAKATNRLSAGSMITFAVSEAVAIYGLVLFILSGNSNDFFIFMAISLFYFYIFYPKYTDWERLLVQERKVDKSRKKH